MKLAYPRHACANPGAGRLSRPDPRQRRAGGGRQARRDHTRSRGADLRRARAARGRSRHGEDDPRTRDRAVDRPQNPKTPKPHMLNKLILKIT